MIYNQIELTLDEMNYEQSNITESELSTQVKTENQVSKKLPLWEIPRVVIMLFTAILLFVAALYYGIINP
ncbi:hypothetical protein [Floridanema aerugineum]|uniref:Uncharacterized protein n=1 Tax=Floridaenema aerugineum BLCC-F46 TaxID=3153654 RepID=A0ABV4X699_9CYAN